MHIIKKYPLISLIVFAVAVRIVLLLVFPFPSQDGGDFVFYHMHAQLLLAGEGFGTTAYIAPGWPIFLAGLYSVLGTHTATVLFGQILLGVLLTVLVYLLSRKLLGSRVALWAGGISAAVPVILFQTISFGQGVLLQTVLFVSAVLCMVYAKQTQHLRWSALSGILFGLSALTDPIGLYIPILLIVWIVAVLLYERSANAVVKRRHIVSVMLIVFLFFITLFPWVYRNTLVFGSFSQAPFIVKEIEKDFIQGEKLSRLFLPFTPSGISSLTVASRQMFLVPYNLDILDQNTPRSYKHVLYAFLTGRSPTLSQTEKGIFAIKLFSALMHWAVIVLALWGLWQLRRRSESWLILMLLGYTFVGVTGYGSLSNFTSISHPSEFFFPFLPLLIPFAAYTIVWWHDRYKRATQNV